MAKVVDAQRSNPTVIRMTCPKESNPPIVKRKMSLRLIQEGIPGLDESSLAVTTAIEDLRENWNQI